MSEVYEVDGRENWTFSWEDSRGRFELEWLPDKPQWQRGFRPGNVGGYSLQPVDLDAPFDKTDAHRIAKEHAGQTDLP